MVAVDVSGLSDFSFDTGVAEAAIDELQVLGRSVFANLLGGGSSDRTEETYAGLCGWFWTDIRPSAVRSTGETTVVDGFPFNALEAKSLLGQLLIAQAAAPRRIDLAVDQIRTIWRLRVLRQRERTAPPSAESFGVALVRTAFADAKFQRDALRLMHGHLKTRVFMHPDGPPTTALSPVSVFSLVLARGLPEILPPQVAGILGDIALRMATEPGWAGFWDMWLLRVAGDHPSFTLSTELRSLADLSDEKPLLDAELPDAPDPEQMQDGWRDKTPGYVQQLLSGHC